MARNTKLQAALRFRDSKSEPRTEQADRKTDTILKVAPQSHRELAPFQRAKLGSDCFLAAEVMPLRSLVN